MTDAAEPYPFPGHVGGDWRPVSARTVASWPPGGFAENLVADRAGGILITLHSHARIDRFDPATGECTVFAEFPVPVAGLALQTSGTLWVTGGTVGTSPGHVFRVDASGVVEPWTTVADALFMNGCTLSEDETVLLVCESLTGRILAVDLRTPGWSVWLSNDRLKPLDPLSPGANGIKLRDGWAYVSVTDANTIYRIRLNGDGTPGDIETFAEQLRADDFAFSSSGAMFIATHPVQTVMRLHSSHRSTVAGPDQGTVGSTACAFGTATGDEGALYVTTNGGIYRPHEGVLQPARLVRLEVGLSP